MAQDEQPQVPQRAGLSLPPSSEDRRRDGRRLTAAMIAAMMADGPITPEPAAEVAPQTPREPMPSQEPEPQGPEPHEPPPANESPVDEAAAVRPYLISGGRTRPDCATIPIEALVETLRIPTAGLPTEQRRLLDLSAGQYLSVAELSAHLKLPVGVVRVVVGDLQALQLLRVHILEMTEADLNLPSLDILESVLYGIASL